MHSRNIIKLNIKSLFLSFLRVFHIVLYTFYIKIMENNRKTHKTDIKKYSGLNTNTETFEKPYINNIDPNSHLDLNINFTLPTQNEEEQNQSSTQSLKHSLNSQLVTQRRFRKKIISKESVSKQSLSSSGQRQLNEALKVRRIIRITDLVKLFFEKLTRNSIFRQPVEFDPYENQISLSRNKIIYGISKIQIPKKVQNLLLVSRIVFIICYIFVFPLTLIFQQVEKCEFTILLKAVAIFFCVLDILQLCQYEDLQQYSERNSAQDYERIIKEKKNGVIILIILILMTIVSLALCFMQESIGSFLFVGIAANISTYLNHISKLEGLIFKATHYEKYWNIIKVLSMNLVVCHLLACVLIAVALIKPDDSWMITNNINHSPWFQQYIWSYYFGTTIILTIGFGDLHPGNFIQAFFIIIISFCACLFFGYNINYIGNLINQIKQDELQKNNKLKIFNSLAKRTEVSKTTFAQIQNYIIQSSKIKQQSNYAQQKELIKQLPQGMRSSFLAETNHKVFNHLKKMIPFTNKTIQKLSLKIQAKICHPNQILKKKGEGFNLLILQSGQIGYIANRKESRLHNLVIERIVNTNQQESKLICADVLDNEPINYDIKSLAYSIIYEMSGNLFEQCVRNCKQDYEIYRQTLDKCKYKLNQFAIVLCKFCENKYHTLFQCPKLHFQPFRKILPYRYNSLKNAQKQSRARCIRNKQEMNFYDYSSGTLKQLSVASQSPILQARKRHCTKLASKRKSIYAGLINPARWSTNQSNNESYLMTLQVVTQIREDIQKLKVENSEVPFEFALWSCTDCDEIANFKYYFPKFNSSELNQRLVKTNMMNISKNYKKKMTKKIWI